MWDNGAKTASLECKENGKIEWWIDDFRNVMCSLRMKKERALEKKCVLIIQKKCVLIIRKNPHKREGILMKRGEKVGSLG